MTVRRPAAILAIAAAMTGAAAPAQAAFGVSVGPAPVLGPFVPGATAAYAATFAATVESDEPGAVLTVDDASGGTAPGHLQHAGTGQPLEAPLLAAATPSAPGATGSPPTPLGAAPTVLVAYPAPLAAPDPVVISLTQRIDAAEPLRTGRYGTTLVLTLTSTP